MHFVSFAYPFHTSFSSQMNLLTYILTFVPSFLSSLLVAILEFYVHMILKHSISIHFIELLLS